MFKSSVFLSVTTIVQSLLGKVEKSRAQLCNRIIIKYLESAVYIEFVMSLNSYLLEFCLETFELGFVWRVSFALVSLDKNIIIVECIFGIVAGHSTLFYIGRIEPS